VSFANERLGTLTAMDEQELLTATEATDDLLEEELLVEEISIDGMCGVY
jgi:mycofactocin precursor